MQREIIKTDLAPAAIGPYAQANLIGGNLLFTSGQIPLDPQTGELVGDTISEQTTRVMENLRAIVEAAGSSLENVVKTTVFITDLAGFSEFNEVYSRYFSGEVLPARSTVEVSGLARGAMIEVEAIAIVV
jgi:2-iminobutanoate/2-iminopropanoate deaminase